jgi:hypothetical protein
VTRRAGGEAGAGKKVAALCSAAKFREETSKKQEGNSVALLRCTI